MAYGRPYRGRRGVGSRFGDCRGQVKYEGFDGRDALVREKRREDALRSLGYHVVRLTWRDLHDPARVDRLIREAFSRT